MIALALAVATLAAGPRPAGAAAPAARPARGAAVVQTRLSPSPCRFPVPAGYAVGCHDLVVPERTGGARTIALHVAVYAAMTATPDAEPVVFLAGGPGDDATGAVRTLVAGGAFDAILASRPLVVVDQRGSGASRPSLACLSEETLGGCRDRLRTAGVDLGAYTNDANADDVVALVGALGARKVHLFGVSYGTRLALTVVARRPSLVRSLVLDSVAPPQLSLGVAALQRFEESIDGLFRTCEQSTSCRRRYPALRTVFDRTLTRLVREPFRFGALPGDAPADPDEAFGAADYALLVWELLQATDAIPYLPLLLEAADEGDFLTLLDFLGSMGAETAVSVGANYSVECTGPERLQTARQLQEAARGLRPSIREGVRTAFADLAGACSVWGVPAPASRPAAVRSDIPALLLSGGLDTSTPAANATVAARTLSRSTSVVVPGTGHVTFARSTCARTLVAAFLARPGSRLDTTCARRSNPVTFLERWPEEEFDENGLGDPVVSGPPTPTTAPATAPPATTAPATTAPATAAPATSAPVAAGVA